MPVLTYLERYRNEGTRTYSPHAAYSECRPEYRPTGPAAGFDLPAWDLPRSALRIYRADPPPEVEARYLPVDRALFVVHPQVLLERPGDPWLARTTSLGRPVASLRVTPTSSTRTLVVAADAGGAGTAVPLPPHALKVHFPFRVSRYGRRMREEVVAQAVAVSGEMQRWRGGGDPTFAFLREVLGVAHPWTGTFSERGENWGYVVRDLRPFPRVEEGRRLVPGFALYGRDRFDPGVEPLISQLTDAGDPLGWALEQVLLPIVRHWVACYRELGLILEPHGQNVLLEIDEAGEVRRIVHRDLSVGVDMRRRRALGLPDGALNGYNRFEDGTFASIAYDRFMGGHFFDYMVRALSERHPALAAEDFRAPCRETFGELFAEHDHYMPSTVQYFSEQRDQHGKPLSTDTGQAPVWRP